MLPLLLLVLLIWIAIKWYRHAESNNRRHFPPPAVSAEDTSTFKELKRQLKNSKVSQVGLALCVVAVVGFIWLNSRTPEKPDLNTDVCNSGLGKVAKYAFVYRQIRGCIARHVSFGQTCEKAVPLCVETEPAKLEQRLQETARLRSAEAERLRLAAAARERHQHLMATDKSYRQRQMAERAGRTALQADLERLVAINRECSLLCEKRGAGGDDVSAHVACVEDCVSQTRH